MQAPSKTSAIQPDSISSVRRKAPIARMHDDRTKRRKATTGCIGCRLRRKKCDEEKPRCLSCLRNGLLCTWPEAGNKEHAELLRRTNSTRRRSQACKADHNSTNGTSPATSSTSWSPSALSPDEESSSEESLILKQAFLEISSCVLRDLDPHTLLGNSLLKQPFSRKLFHHYLHRTNKAMATCHGTDNPFLTELVPLAMSSHLILNALLACSGVHYAHLSGVSVDQATWMHYGQAIQGQKYALTQLAQGNKDSIVPLLVTAVVLCIVEVSRRPRK